jgi:hypothetical protein
MCLSEITQLIKMIENSTLQLPDYNSEFYLQTNEGNHAIGATLSQMVGTTLQPVAFYSKPLSDIEYEKSTTFRNLIAINYAINHFKLYLQDRKFTLITKPGTLTECSSLAD